MLIEEGVGHLGEGQQRTPVRAIPAAVAATPVLLLMYDDELLLLLLLL